MKMRLALALCISLLLFPHTAYAFEEGDEYPVPFYCNDPDLTFLIVDSHALGFSELSENFLTAALIDGDCVETEMPRKSYFLIHKGRKFGTEINGGFVWEISNEKNGEAIGYIGIFEQGTAL